jgi:DNA polymerase-1
VAGKGTIYVIDGSSLVFRAYFALPADLATSSGQPTNALHGFVSMLLGLLRDRVPSGVAVAFDRPEPTFRDDIVGDYKAQRPPVPEDLISQIPKVRRLVEAMGIPTVEAIGYEADDVLATLATKARDQERECVVVTGDRDAFQLVEDPYVRVLYTLKGLSYTVLYDEKGIMERTGAPPRLYPLLAALRGDPSDNLPGVPGIGEKTAAKLATTYGSLDAIYAHLDELSPRLRESLAEHEEQVRMNARVIPLVRDVPLPIDLDGLAIHQVGLEEAGKAFEEMELKTLWRRAIPILGLGPEQATADNRGGDGGATASRPSGTSGASATSSKDLPAPEGTRAQGAPRRIPLSLGYEALAKTQDLATQRSRLESLLGSTAPLGAAAVFESEPGRSPLVGVAFARATRAATGRVVELSWIEAALLAEEPARSNLESLLSANGPGVACHGAKELMRSLLARGVDMTGLVMDPGVAAYLLDPTGPLDLASIAYRYANILLRAEASLAGGAGDMSDGASVIQESLAMDLAEGHGGDGPAEASATAAKAAAALLEAFVCLDLIGPLEEELDKTGVKSLHDEVERPLVRVLARMEVAGIRVDRGELERIVTELTERAAELEAEVQRLAGRSFNVNSTPQLRKVLYEDLGLQPGKRTKTGYSTDAQTLNRLRGEHPVVDALLAYREVEKLRSTYGESLLSEIGPDGRIHATFNQTVARTGRLSSDRPNLHNIPVRSDEGKRFRRVFVPEAGSLFVVADYDQVELRVIAHLSKDEGLLAAFAQGVDIHRATASRVFGVPPEEVTPEQRNRAKMVAYGLAYGMEAYGLAQRLGISTGEAQPILDAYFEAFPAVRELMERSIAEARANGYTRTELGRRRPLPDLNSPNRAIRQAAERQATNAGIQGLAADLFKIALVNLDARLEAHPSGSRLVLQVHDEVIVESPAPAAAEVALLVERVLVEAGERAGLSVPLEATCRVGDSWAGAKQDG